MYLSLSLFYFLQVVLSFQLPIPYTRRKGKHRKLFKHVYVTRRFSFLLFPLFFHFDITYSDCWRFLLINRKERIVLQVYLLVLFYFFFSRFFLQWEQTTQSTVYVSKTQESSLFTLPISFSLSDFYKLYTIYLYNLMYGFIKNLCLSYSHCAIGG